MKIELENWKDALDLLGHDNPFANKGNTVAILVHSRFIPHAETSRPTDFHHVPTTDGGIKVSNIIPLVRNSQWTGILKAAVKLEASMCYVRGQAHMKLGDTTKAKASFKEALIVDVKCYNVSSGRVFDEWERISFSIFGHLRVYLSLRRWMHCCHIICLKSIWVCFQSFLVSCYAHFQLTARVV